MMDWVDKNVLITGVNGFIGSALARFLEDAGANVVGLSHRTDRRGYNIDLVEFADVRDVNAMRRIIATNEIEHVFHLAASSIVRSSARDPFGTYDVNVMGTVSVLEACRQVGESVRSIVIASSDKAYGGNALPYIESTPLLASNTYDVSKACADMIARSYASNYDMPVVVTRASNVYGPGDPNASRLIPNTVIRLLRGERPILYSDTARMVREFIHIDDVVSAYELISKHTMDIDLRGHAVNIGGNGPVNVQDVVEMIRDVMKLSDDKSTLPIIVERESSFREIREQCIDAGRLERMGWKRSVSLRDGLTSVVRFYESGAR